MSDNSNSPLDLGTLLINGNDAMLSNKSQSSNGNDIQSKLISKNPITNLTDDQANALSSVINAAHKNDAKSFVSSHGVDNATALVALHNLTSPNNQDNNNGSGNNNSSINPQQPKQETSNQINIRPQGMFERNNVYGQYLENQGKIQNLKAGQPSEIGLPQAQIGQLQAQKEQIEQQINGLTPEQQAQAIGNYNSSLVQQHENLQKSVTEQMTSTASAIEQLVKNTPLLDKAPGSPYYDTLKTLQTRMSKLSSGGTDIIDKFKNLQLTNPRTGKTNNSQPNQEQINAYNNLRAKGISMEEAKRKAGL